MRKDGHEASCADPGAVALGFDAEMLRLAAVNGRGLMRTSELQVRDDIKAQAGW